MNAEHADIHKRMCEIVLDFMGIFREKTTPAEATYATSILLASLSRTQGDDIPGALQMIDVMCRTAKEMVKGPGDTYPARTRGGVLS